MKYVVYIAGVVVLLLAGFAIWVRVAPTDPAAWHVDPLTVTRPGGDGHYMVRPAVGDSAGPLFDATPEQVMTEFDRVAMAAPRTRVLAGSAADGFVTYVQRSRLWGFPDYISVRAVAAEGGTRLAVFSRLRFGESDMGVNKARIEDWIGQMGLPRVNG